VADFATVPGMSADHAIMESPTPVDALPHVEVRGPTVGPLFDPQQSALTRRQVLGTTAVAEPTVLVYNLEGRFPSSAVLHEFISGIGSGLRSGLYGQLVVVVATPDQAVRDVLRALAAAHEVPLWLTASAESPWLAEPALPLSPAEEETLELVSALGGRVTVSSVAQASGLDHTAAGNRLAGLDRRHLLFKLARAPRHGHLYLDPRAGRPASSPTASAQPASGSAAH
jgi:hypothetical protein